MSATGLASSAIVVSPGQTVQTIGAILDTQACRNAPNPATCDDQVMDDNIVAGPNGIAETEAYNETTSFGLVLSSAWRNPQRNEAVGGVISSRHQFGDAVDLQVGTVTGKTRAQLYCILQTAADAVPNANGFAEQKREHEDLQ